MMKKDEDIVHAFREKGLFNFAFISSVVELGFGLVKSCVRQFGFYLGCALKNCGNHILVREDRMCTTTGLVIVSPEASLLSYVVKR